MLERRSLKISQIYLEIVTQGLLRSLITDQIYRIQNGGSNMAVEVYKNESDLLDSHLGSAIFKLRGCVLCYLLTHCQ